MGQLRAAAKVYAEVFFYCQKHDGTPTALSVGSWGYGGAGEYAILQDNFVLLPSVARLRRWLATAIRRIDGVLPPVGHGDPV